MLSHIKALPFDFESAVSAHIKALEAHRFTENEPAPAAPHPLVELAVARVQYPIEAGIPDTFVPAYRIVDDTPPPPTLEERKEAMAAQLAAQAKSVIDGIVPPLKRRLWDFQYSEAATTTAALRTPDQKAFIVNHDARNERVYAVNRHLAQLHSDVHDLTETTIDRWTPAPFPK